MNKTVVISVAILAVGAVVSVVFHAQATRYVTVNAGEGRVYRVDRRTGESVLLAGVREIPIEKSKPPQAQDPNLEAVVEAMVIEEAIRLAKDAHTLGSRYNFSNESEIRLWLREQKGELRVLGWDARRVDEQTAEAQRLALEWDAAHLRR